MSTKAARFNPTHHTQHHQPSPDKVRKAASWMSDNKLAHKVLLQPDPITRPMLAELQRAAGNQAVARLLEQRQIQAKLIVGAAHDTYEQEADRVSQQVMTSPQAAPPAVQRHGEEEQIQTWGTRSSSFDAGDGIEQAVQKEDGGGAPLPQTVRSFMEPRFGADFSGVRVHAGAEANTLNRKIQSRAFTHATDIYFAGGQYDPHTSPGQQLLAHELTHTIQQGAVPVKTAQRQPLHTNTRRLQRHPLGKELPDKDDQVKELNVKKAQAPQKIGKNGPLPPQATRTAQVEFAEKKAGKEAGKTFITAQKLTPGAMSLAGAEKILQGAYGGLKKIVPGSIVILADQPACSRKYDELCIAENIPRDDGTAWAYGDCDKDDIAAGVQTEGFAWKGVVYVNGKTPLVTATAHEILHNNTEPKFRGVVGETFNEGVTETLARKALTDAGIKVPSVTAYPQQVEITKLLIDLVGIDVVEKGYFQDVQELVRMYLRKGSSTWTKLKQAAEALDVDKAKAALKRGFGT